jgi:hypothetical protein
MAALVIAYVAFPRRQGSEYLLVHPVTHYEQQPTTFPSNGKTQTWGFMRVTFTNPTTQAIWYVQRPHMMLNPLTLREPDPATVIAYRRTWEEYGRQKLSGFPGSLISGWGLWRELALGDLANEPVHKLRPGEARTIQMGAVSGRPLRVGIVRRFGQHSNAAWITNWSETINPPPPPKR